MPAISSRRGYFEKAAYELMDNKRTLNKRMGRKSTI